jgi:hypothetical protein
MSVVIVVAAIAIECAADVTLPVPRTLDLTHVEAANYAVALAKDRQKIFDFMRDQIAYQAYTGALRGPRGTLLAMAGNSVDRAALSASLLTESGQKVRFVRGTLSEPHARTLVTSMWVERPRSPQRQPPPPSPALKAASDAAAASIKRNYELLRTSLTRLTGGPPRTPVVPLADLIKEAQRHYWVEFQRDGQWVAFDPSFPDAAIGQSRGSREETLEALPEKLFHRINIKVRLEEYEVLLEGSTPGTATQREVLTHAMRAADLSGADVILTHHPENWTGPARDLPSALASALNSTGLMKPVLLVGRRTWIVGKAFRPTPPSGGGGLAGGLADMLGGAGTRKPVPVATAETLELELIAPDGRKTTITREIFDLVGKARRTEGRPLTTEEVRTRSTARADDEVNENVYSLLFTTGRIDREHLANVVETAPPTSAEASDLRGGLRRVAVGFVALSDSMLARIGDPGRGVTLFYPDAPRVHIIEMSTVDGKPRFAVDLRHSAVRAVTNATNAGDAFYARVIRGVVEGALERALAEMVTTGNRDIGWAPVVSTTALVDRAQADGVGTITIAPNAATANVSAPPDTQARVREEVRNGYAIVTPPRTILIANQPRLGWWRIDPRTGDTVGVTDDGLHAGVAVGYIERQGSAVTYAERVEIWLVYQVSPIAGAGARYVTVRLSVLWLDYLSITSMLPRLGGD